MKTDSRIFVAGHRGLVGSAVVRRLQAAGYTNILTASRDQLDLRDQAAVSYWFKDRRPEYVYLVAGTVGGIMANSTRPAEFIYENLMLEANVIHCAHRAGVQRLLFLGSSCIYPKLAPQPIQEDSLLTGALEPTNEWYAIAKITGIKLCAALRKQHGFDAICLMPTNLYGPGDNYHPTNSHVLPALIRRFHEASERPEQGLGTQVSCWGTGTPLREFLHVDDLGEACLFALERWSPGPEAIPYLNVGTGLDLSIGELAKAVAEATGFRGEIVWDPSQSDGTPKKQLDVSRLSALGWQARIPLATGLQNTVDLFRQQLQHQLVRL